MTTFDLLTIGHSNIPAPRFIAMLRAAGANAIADVRSMPVSRFCPWFSAKISRRYWLARAWTTCSSAKSSAAGRAIRRSIATALPITKSPITKPWRGSRASKPGSNACCTCRAASPLPDVFRTRAARLPSLPLVARALAARGASIGHILYDGAIEPHATTEQRLLQLADADNDLFVSGQHDRLAAAYRRRSRAVAYRVKNAANAATVAPKKVSLMLTTCAVFFSSFSRLALSPRRTSLHKTLRPIPRRPARSIPSRCRRCNMRTPRRRPRSFLRASRRRFPVRRARSAPIRTVAWPAPCRCRPRGRRGK